MVRGYFFFESYGYFQRLFGGGRFIRHSLAPFHEAAGYFRTLAGVFSGSANHVAHDNFVDYLITYNYKKYSRFSSVYTVGVVQWERELISFSLSDNVNIIEYELPLLSEEFGSNHPLR
jgi:hypothetical protein